MKFALILLIPIFVFMIRAYLMRSQKSKPSTDSLTAQEAYKIAEQYLRSSRHQMTLRTEMTQEFDFGFVFYYASKKWLKTRNISDMVPGNGPLVVDRRDRKVYPLTTSQSSDQAIKEYQRKWRS